MDYYILTNTQMRHLDTLAESLKLACENGEWEEAANMVYELDHDQLTYLRQNHTELWRDLYDGEPDDHVAEYQNREIDAMESRRIR